MADVRINALSTTATSAASDDYLALDGSANGTRKILATNIAQNVTDVTFGSGGPSAKSSIAARAARQGLVGNGTAESTATLTSALGSTDKSLAVTVLVNEAGNGIFHFGTSNSTVARQLQLTLLTTRKLRVELLGATTGDIRQANTDSAIADNGKFAHVVCTISGSTLTIYVNGVSVSYTEVTAGTPPAWSDTVNGTAVEIGGASGASFASTALETPYVYNRALTAAEVVSLYEAGVPSGADYATPAATNTNQITGDAWWDTKTGSVSSGTLTMTSGQYVLRGAVLTKGKRYRTTYNVTALTGTVQVGNTSAAPTVVQNVSLGAGSFEFTANDNGAFGFNASSGTATITNVTFIPVGLLLAPDAAQAGGGLTWYDTSGNAANITLPASGVSWNVPSSLKTASGWTFGGAINATGTSVVTAGYWRTKPTADDGTLTGLSLANSGGTQVGVADVNTLTGEIRVGGTSSAYYLSFYSKNSLVGNFGVNGELLLGTSGVNSSNGKLQLATHTTSAGGIGFGTDTSFNRIAAGKLALTDSGSTPTLSLYASSTERVRIEASGASAYISTVDASASLYLRSGNLTTALTLDSSQRTIANGAFWSSSTGNTSTNGFNNATSIANNLISLYASTGSANIQIAGRVTTFDGGSGYYGLNLQVPTSAYPDFSGTVNWTNALTLTSQRCILSGALRLNNTFQSGAPTATGYVTIQDAAGNTYKVLVGT